MKSLILIFSTVVINCFSFAQVTVIKDPKIDGLVKSQSQVVAPSTAPTIAGYRVQLAFDSNKSVIEDARAKFNTSFPKVDSYVEFVAPHFFLKVGDFRTQLEAEKVKMDMMLQFPAAFIVKERVNLPRIDQ